MRLSEGNVVLTLSPIHKVYDLVAPEGTFVFIVCASYESLSSTAIVTFLTADGNVVRIRMYDWFITSSLMKVTP